MPANNAKEYYAMSAAVIEVRSKLKGMVQREEILTRSPMLAYERTAQRIGRSESWVRGFLRGDSRFNPSFVLAKNIERLCEHIEAGNEKIRAEDAAAHQSNSGMHRVTDSAALLPPNDY